MKVGSYAAGLGIVAGGWAAVAGFLLNSEAFRPQCHLDTCAAVPSWYSAAIGTLGGLVFLGSLAGLVGPKRAYYLEGGAATAVVILLLGVWGEIEALYYWSILVPALLTAVLAVAAARSKTGMSEQSNPMNLPVFG
ncbi:MAG: hypothetical protein HY297_02640 [Thaumarchaeota archaeon]|nr:hypothetical protein [Nitrososphaerota archaeon]